MNDLIIPAIALILGILWIISIRADRSRTCPPAAPEPTHRDAFYSDATARQGETVTYVSMNWERYERDHPLLEMKTREYKTFWEEEYEK